nr:MAG TPA: hypothetical protein [Caudoviricetes sp.]
MIFAPYNHSFYKYTSLYHIQSYIATVKVILSNKFYIHLSKYVFLLIHSYSFIP